MSNRSIDPDIGRYQREPKDNGNEEVFRIPQIFKARALPSDGLRTTTKHSVGARVYSSREIQSVIFIIPAEWAQ